MFLLFEGSAVRAQVRGYFHTTIVRVGELSFPIFGSAKKGRAVDRINKFLQLRELYFLIKAPYDRRIFKQATANDGSIYGGKFAMSTHVFANNARILSVGFDETSAGATTHYWSQYYNFNPKNGDRISLSDLFSEKGYQAFLRDVIKRRSTKYRREVRKKIPPEFQESYLETLRCIEGDNDLSDYYIRHGRIFIDGNGCLTKGQLFDGLDMLDAFRPSTFGRYLNAYGKAVFGLSTESTSRFRSTRLPQLFEGSVDNRYPIAMILEDEGFGSLWGMYAYLRYGEGISLRGENSQGELHLTGSILSPTATSSGPLGTIRRVVKNGWVEGRLTEDGFDGTWSDLERTKQFPFKVKIR